MLGLLKSLPICLAGCVVGFAAAVSTGVCFAAVPCAGCHTETAAKFLNEAHGRAFTADPNAACQACHGDGTAHVTAPTDRTAMRSFVEESAQEINTTCAKCHAGAHPAGANPHQQAGLACTSCHAVHHEKKNFAEP